MRRHFLPERPEYIPVYIQLGDEPPSDPLEYERLVQQAFLSRTNDAVSLKEVDNKVNNEKPPAQSRIQVDKIKLLLTNEPSPLGREITLPKP